jgi:hypothetical protein
MSHIFFVPLRSNHSKHATINSLEHQMQIKKATNVESTGQLSRGCCPVRSKRFIAVNHKDRMVLIDARFSNKSVSLNRLGETIWGLSSGMLFLHEMPSKCRQEMGETEMPDSRIVNVMQTMQQQGLLMFGDHNDKV